MFFEGEKKVLLILVFSYAQNMISNTLQHKQVNTRPGCACFARSYYVKNKENGGFAMPEKNKNSHSSSVA